MQIETLNRADIMSMPLSEPERLFGPDPSALKEVFRALAKAWHPDRNRTDGAASVFEHIAKLRDVADGRAAKGDWRTPGLVRFDAVDGRRYEVSFRRRHDFELGEVYVGRTCIAYALRKDAADLFGAAEKTMGKLVFRDAAMKSVFGGRMPRVVKSFATADRLVVVLGKTADQVLLRDLIAHCGGRLDPKHVAWIVSDLESIASYLGMPSVGVVHPAFGPDTLLVSPKFHSVTVAGGWWYAAAEGTKLTAAPGRAVAHIPPAILSAGSAGARAMLEMVRLTACEALGHSGPVLVQRDPLVPPPLKRWLLDPPMETAVDDYKSWGVAREASFGPRRFVELAVDPEEIYRRI